MAILFRLNKRHSIKTNIYARNLFLFIISLVIKKAAILDCKSYILPNHFVDFLNHCSQCTIIYLGM